MSDTPRTDKFAQKFLLTWNQFAYRSDEDIAKQFQNTDDALDLARQLERELAEAKRNYMELIMSVGNKYPNETRHETAKRYIQERENTPIHGPYSVENIAQKCAAAIRKGEKESLTVAERKPVPEFELIEKWEGE